MSLGSQSLNAVEFHSGSVDALLTQFQTCIHSIGDVHSVVARFCQCSIEDRGKKSERSLFQVGYRVQHITMVFSQRDAGQNIVATKRSSVYTLYPFRTMSVAQSTLLDEFLAAI